MGTVIANMSMSLDGFIEDRTGDTSQHLFGWTQSGPQRSRMGGRHPAGVPVVVVTHQAPTEWPHPDAPITFVTDGVGPAIRHAQKLAGSKSVAVASADIARQCLDQGLLDAIAVDLVPVLLGGGKPWFAGLADAVPLTDPVITEGDGVTHLVYRVGR